VEFNFYWSECDLRYHGNFVPGMKWTGPGVYSNDNSVTESDVWSRISFVAQREIEGNHFQCTTSFTVPAGLPPDFATNTPTYHHVFTGSLLIVNWGPQSLDLQPVKPIYDVGDVLTCTADARPNPLYQWTNLRTLVTETQGSTFTVGPDLVGTNQTMRCNAQSLIERTLYTLDAFINVPVSDVTTPSTTPTTTTSTTPPPDAPCLDLTGQWTSTNPSASICLEVDTRGNLLVLIRNGTDPLFIPGTGKTVYNDYKHLGFTALWPAGPGFATAGFVGECHRCNGNEVIFMSGLARSKDDSPSCAVSGGTRLTSLYVFTRYGPPCRTPPGKVFRPSEQHIKAMDIRPENIVT